MNWSFILGSFMGSFVGTFFMLWLRDRMQRRVRRGGWN